MERELAEKFCYDYLTSDLAEDVDESELINRVEKTFSNKTTYLSKHEIAKVVKNLQGEKEMYRGNAPRLSADELEAKIREVMKESDSHWYLEDAIAYIVPIGQRILDSRGTTVRYDAESLTPFIDAAELPIRSTIERALAGGWAISKFQRFQGGDKFALQIFRRENHPDPESAQAWCGIINQLGREQGWQLNQNGLQNRYDAAAAKAKASVSRNGKFPVWSPSHGQIRWHPASELDAMDPDQLLATVTAARDLYKKMGESRDQQRERLQDMADASAGLRRYREGDLDSLSGSVQYKESSLGAGFEFVEGSKKSEVKPTANPRMDRSVPAPANLPPHIQQLFTDPATDKFYSKSSLHKLARTNTQLFRRMMNSGFIEFMNKLLAQPE